MLGKLKKIKDGLGNYIYPITVSSAVYVDDTTTLETKLSQISSIGGGGVVGVGKKEFIPSIESTAIGALPLGMSKVGNTTTNVKEIDWFFATRPPLPRGRGTTIQGMVWIEGALYCTVCSSPYNSWNDYSMLFRYFPNEVRWEQLPSIPLDHPSGLIWYNNELWCCDYDGTENIVKYNLKKAIAMGTFAGCETGRFSTGGVGGISTIAMVNYQGVDRLLMSIFLGTNKSYLVNFQKALTDGNIANSIVAEWTHYGSVQGSVWDGQYLWESYGGSTKKLSKIDINIAATNGTVQSAVVYEESTPTDAPEDLAFDGVNLWMGDEWNQGIFKREKTKVLYSTTSGGTITFDNFDSATGTTIEAFARQKRWDQQQGLAFNILDANNYCTGEVYTSYTAGTNKYLTVLRFTENKSGTFSTVKTSTSDLLVDGTSQPSIGLKLTIKDSKVVLEAIGFNGEVFDRLESDKSAFTRQSGKVGLRPKVGDTEWLRVKIEQI